MKTDVISRLKRRNVAATACVALLFAFAPVLAMADIITPPSPGAALHRIGMEVLVETAVGVAAGSAALRLLFKLVLLVLMAVVTMRR